VTETISEVAQLPREAMWVVFEDVAADDVVRGTAPGQRAQAQGRPGMSGVEIRDERFETVGGRALSFEKLVGDCIFTARAALAPR
jgi:hypothetical protein